MANLNQMKEENQIEIAQEQDGERGNCPADHRETVPFFTLIHERSSTITG
jgi:hypothetical protein